MGLFAAAAIILGYVESLIPFFAGIPGIKLGLANLAVLFILEKYTWKEAALVSVVRIWFSDFSSEICSAFFTVSQEPL